MTVTAPPVYELWDTEAGNLIADYTDEDTALQAVRAGVDNDGFTHWTTVALVRVEPGGVRAPIAQGAALVSRAMGTLNVDTAKVEAALALVDILTSPAFQRAMIDLRTVLAHSFNDTLADLDVVRAAVFDLSRAAGVAVRLEIEGPHLILVTPSKTMADLLAIGVPYGPMRDESPVRAVTDGYAVDIAA